ncbi:hypothetical protein JHK86_020181 [Glycine max]|nr:hypothetical protein JHK86_020181 [Glycine max]
MGFLGQVLTKEKFHWLLSNEMVISIFCWPTLYARLDFGMVSGSQQLVSLVKWINAVLPNFNLPLDTSEEELRAWLRDGSVLCSILDNLVPGSVKGSGSLNELIGVKRFLVALDELGLSGFELSDLEQGSMVPVLQCLETLKTHFAYNAARENIQSCSRKRWDQSNLTSFEESDSCLKDASKLQHAVDGSVVSDEITSVDHTGIKSNELFQLKQGLLADFSDAKLNEVLKSNNLDSVSTQLLFNIGNRILSDIFERKNGDVPQVEQTKFEEKKKLEEQDFSRLKKEKVHSEIKISELKQDLEIAKRTYEEHVSELELQATESKAEYEKRIEGLKLHLADARMQVKELEAFSESRFLKWKNKEDTYQTIVNFQVGAFQELRAAMKSVKDDVIKTKRNYLEEFKYFGRLKGLAEAAENYHVVIAENRKLYNEVQDLKEEIFKDTQPLIRSVLDGYNVCIFAYGQTGSGKTYTMEKHTKYCFLDLHTLGIWNTAQPNGLAVPDASMHSVNSMADVLELMNIGLTNRATSATALNERSSRSHSVLSVHVRGTDLKTNTLLRGCLHLVDLAGSERVDRSEATGDRLKEAQHINKSLSALGDVIFALSQKSSHVPYRNSKLTQLLQSGQAKTLMFVQLNPDVASYSETVSTLKFAERVSGVELGAARSNKEGRDVRELMEQLASLKDVIARKDEEIERLQSLKANHNGAKLGMISARHGSSSPRRHSIGTPRNSMRLAGARSFGVNGKAASEMDNCSEYSDKHSEAGSHQSMDDFRNKSSSLRLKLTRDDSSQNVNEDIDLLRFGDADSEERLSDISDGGLSMGTETEGSISSIVEYTLFPELEKAAEITPVKDTTTDNLPAESTEKLIMPSKIPKAAQVPQKVQSRPSRLSLNKTSSKVLSSVRKPAASSSSSVKPPKRWQ